MLRVWSGQCHYCEKTFNFKSTPPVAFFTNTVQTTTSYRMKKEFQFSCTMMLAVPRNAEPFSSSIRLCFPRATLYCLLELQVEKSDVTEIFVNTVFIFFFSNMYNKIILHITLQAFILMCDSLPPDTMSSS